MERLKILEVIGVFEKAWRGAGRERLKYCCAPLVWLNQGRWDDDPEEWQRQAGGNVPPAQNYEPSGEDYSHIR